MAAVKGVQVRTSGSQGGYVDMTNKWGSAWEAPNAPNYPLDVNIIGADGDAVRARPRRAPRRPCGGPLAASGAVLGGAQRAGRTWGRARRRAAARAAAGARADGRGAPRADDRVPGAVWAGAAGQDLHGRAVQDQQPGRQRGARARRHARLALLPRRGDGPACGRLGAYEAGRPPVSALGVSVLKGARARAQLTEKLDGSAAAQGGGAAAGGPAAGPPAPTPSPAGGGGGGGGANSCGCTDRAPSQYYTCQQQARARSRDARVGSLAVQSVRVRWPPAATAPGAGRARRARAVPTRTQAVSGCACGETRWCGRRSPRGCARARAVVDSARAWGRCEAGGALGRIQGRADEPAAGGGLTVRLGDSWQERG